MAPDGNCERISTLNIISAALNALERLVWGEIEDSHELKMCCLLVVRAIEVYEMRKFAD